MVSGGEMKHAAEDRIGIVVIGRNEGERLKACLRSVVDAGPVVYVDSGSTDGSQDFARSLGVDLVELAVPPNFTAARARNAGLARLLERAPGIEFVQMVDGDCQVQPGWIPAAEEALSADPELALVFGRRRERFPERSIYNALCDDEWDIPVGEASGCGGDALFRVAALESVSGYNPAIIAGEDTEMGMRLRKAGWHLRRIAGEMTLHDANILRFGQWWQRTKRGGHGFAEMAYIHPDARWPNWPRTCRSIVLWGALIPVAIMVLVLAGLLVTPWALLPALVLLLGFPIQMARIGLRKRRAGLPSRVAAAAGILLMVGKIPEFLGFARYHLNRLSGRRSHLIEYKGGNR
jgi:glycosyltransferase involved in cell wall biosynthesis